MRLLVGQHTSVQQGEIFFLRWPTIKPSPVLESRSLKCYIQSLYDTVVRLLAGDAL